MHNKLKIIAVCMTLMLTVITVAVAQPFQGKTAESFTLKDISGKVYDLMNMKELPMTVLYFFDTGSSSNLDGLLMLDALSKKYKDANLNVWGITLSDKSSVSAFVSGYKPVFPVLLDESSHVSDVYDAKMILPTVCIIGPDLKIIDYFQGGGKSTEVMLARIAERKLAQRETKIASKISETVEKMNPENYETVAIKGYAALREGNTVQAESIFTGLSKGKGASRVVGAEGLAAVYIRTGKTDKALELLEEVEKIAPERSYASALKGNILYSQNKKEAAKEQFEKAITKKEGTAYQKAMAFNQLGRMYANQAEYEKAREFYDNAIDLDPFYIEATSNKGITYEKEGKWDSALKVYKKAQALDASDVFSKTLAKKAEEMLALQKDIENRKRVDTLVKTLAERYKNQKEETRKDADDWTSRPLILTFADIEEKGGLNEADGFSAVIVSRLSELLNDSGRIQVVERIVMDRLLDELNLGSSALSDQETALKLGRIFAAKLIGTGSVLHLPDGALLSIRFVDTETTALAKVVTREIGNNRSLEKDMNTLNRDILKSVIDLYPVKGFVVQAEKGRIMINVGKKQGVVPGTVFDVVEEKPPVEYKGKLLRSSPKQIAEIKVVEVEPDFSYADVIHKERALQQDDKVREKRVTE